MITTGSITRVIKSNQNKNAGDFSVDGKVLFGLLTLIVDIKQRQDNKVSFDNNNSFKYNEGMQTKDVLADKTPLVDNGLLGH